MRSKLVYVLLTLAVAALTACKDPHAPTEADFALFDAYRKPERIMAALPSLTGKRVADIGAGGGYMTLRLARAVGAAGHVVATDIDAKALADLETRAEAATLRNITTRHVQPHDPGLERAHYDLIMLSHVDHLLVDRGDYFKRLVPALTADGIVVVVNTARYRDETQAALVAAGFALADGNPTPPEQFVTLARRPK